nr:MAG TPA: hypothetical protein [Caudoviricetes sp.]
MILETETETEPELKNQFEPEIKMIMQRKAMIPDWR